MASDINKFDNTLALAHKFGSCWLGRYNMLYTFVKPKQIQVLFEGFTGDTLALRMRFM